MIKGQGHEVLVPSSDAEPEEFRYTNENRNLPYLLKRSDARTTFGGGSGSTPSRF